MRAQDGWDGGIASKSARTSGLFFLVPLVEFLFPAPLLFFFVYRDDLKIQVTGGISPTYVPVLTRQR